MLQSAPTNLNDLIESVEHAFDSYDVEKLDKVFITLQSILIQVMIDEGGNSYKIPHMGKDKMLKENGKLPRALKIDGELYRKTLEVIARHMESLSKEATPNKRRKRSKGESLSNEATSLSKEATPNKKRKRSKEESLSNEATSLSNEQEGVVLV